VLGFDVVSSQRIRLLEMGLTEGIEFQIVRLAPLGDPIDVKVRGYHLSLRRKEAGGIRVKPL
jgi:Fe2+ transport system protein FeoA